MPGKPMKLGPFIGGMNTASDPTSIDDRQLVDIVNLELDLDGSLVSRPPFQTTTADTSGWTERIKLLGCTVFNGDPYLIGGNQNGLFYFLSGAWNSITTSFIASSLCQFAGTVYFLSTPDNDENIATWDPTNGFTNVGHGTFDTMSGTDSGGGNLLMYKGRMFYFPGPDKSDNESRLIFSDAGTGDHFAASTQFIDVNPGDGQKLIDGIVYDDNLILFKEHSTYVLSYTSKPDDAELLKVSNTIGASTSNCVVSYENSVFVYHEGNVYEMVNYDFKKINTDVPFVYDSDTDGLNPRKENTFIFLFGDRLMVKYFNRLYVYGLRTKTWSRWESKNAPLNNLGIFVPLPVDVANRPNTEYYAGSCISSNDQFYLIKDGFTATDTEKYLDTSYDIECKITSKTYDMQDPYQFKKQNWWGVDAVTNRTVTASSNPVTLKFAVTWAALADLTWDDLLTWGSPTMVNINNNTIANPTGTTVLRRFMKFPKALRFRQIYYTLKFLTDGSTSQGPVKIFSLVVFGNAKETLPQQVN